MRIWIFEKTFWKLWLECTGSVKPLVACSSVQKSIRKKNDGRPLSPKTHKIYFDQGFLPLFCVDIFHVKSLELLILKTCSAFHYHVSQLISFFELLGMMLNMTKQYLYALLHLWFIHPSNKLILYAENHYLVYNIIMVMMNLMIWS